MREWLGVACFASAFFFGTATWAADVQSVQGDLSINQGQGFQAVNGRIDANVGDSVMVGPSGSATVSYSDGCQVTVQPGAVTTIAPLSPCASGSYAQDSYWGNAGVLVFGALFVGAVGFGVYGITQAKSSAPASP